MKNLYPKYEALILDLDFTLLSHDWHDNAFMEINRIYAEVLATYPAFKGWKLKDIQDKMNEYFFAKGTDFLAWRI